MVSTVNYPPVEILHPSFGKPNFELIILWILNNNSTCTWGDLKKNINRSTLSIYLNRLIDKDFVEKRKFNQYQITSMGKDRFYELSRVGKKRKISYPPEVIKKRRNYDDWILWMVYNNNYLKWSDFLAEPLSINQSSLSKNMNLLIDKGFVVKENKEYRITRSGKLEYSRMLQNYDLDRQSILEEEGKRIKDITMKTINFFEKYGIEDNDIEFRFLNNVLNVPIDSARLFLDSEEQFHKVLLFLSINHPNQYPNYINSADFSKKYDINPLKIDFSILRIVEENAFPIKFFKLDVEEDKTYYFQANEKLEKVLNAIVEEYITKFSYLNNLYEGTSRNVPSLSMNFTISAILDEICGNIFHNSFREALRNFLPDYINYLAYKIEKEKRLEEPLDKLKGLIWQEIQTYNFDSEQLSIIEKIEKYLEKNKVVEALQTIEEGIKRNPKDIELYYSKSKILIDSNRYKEALNLLNGVLEDFPEEERSIQMKRAYVLKQMRNTEAGLEIINELIEKYPEDNDLINYKACWLQYLNRKIESLELIQDLIERIPNNPTYHDTYGEILIFFGEHEHAIEEFQKSIELSSDNWFLFQTYIKLGICYKELENYDLAVKYLQKGTQFADNSRTDLETKRNWLSIANLFLAEIEEIEAEYQ